MGVARFVRDEVDGTGAVATYIHGGGKIGVLVEFGFTKPETAATRPFKTLRQGRRDAGRRRDAAVRQPRRDRRPTSIEHELSIYKAQAAESGKPEAIQEKMAQGRLEKFYKEVVLLEQVFVKNPDITVAQYADADRQGSSATRSSVVGFTRCDPRRDRCRSSCAVATASSRPRRAGAPRAGPCAVFCLIGCARPSERA